MARFSRERLSALRLRPGRFIQDWTIESPDGLGASIPHLSNQMQVEVIVIGC